jgi:hypothetical protein
MYHAFALQLVGGCSIQAPISQRRNREIISIKMIRRDVLGVDMDTAAVHDDLDLAVEEADDCFCFSSAWFCL